MESTFLTTTSLDQRKPSSRKPSKHKIKKMTSPTSKPIKVRYISNPMRVKTCASKFRELVQELTGRDAVDLTPEEEEEGHVLSSPSENNLSPPLPDDLTPRVLHQDPFDDRVLAEYYQPLDGDEMFLPHVSAGFSDLLSNGFYYVNDYGRM